MSIDDLIRQKVYNIQPTIYITTPICRDCGYSRYPRFTKGNVICTAIGNKNTCDVFNSPECRELFYNERHPYIKLAK